MAKTKICPQCGASPMEPYAVSEDNQHELRYRCNKCGFKEFA